MAVLLTEQQRAAVTTRGTSMIVTAAAGSGKTTVLSARVMDFLSHPENTCTELAIVTFTVAAAEEMRARIAKNLREQYEATNDDRLRRESIRIATADIGTIDSFQMRFVREFFREAGVAPNFSVLDEAQADYYKQTVLDAYLEECYETFPEGFEHVLKLFGGTGENETLAKALLSAYEHLQGEPMPDEWIDRRLKLGADPAVWAKAVCDELLPFWEEIDAVYADALARDVFSKMSRETLVEEKNLLQHILKACRNADLKELSHLCASYDSGSFSASKNDVDQVRVREYRDVFRNTLLKSRLLNPLVLNAADKDLDAVMPALCAFAEMVKTYRARMMETYKRLNRYPFEALSELAVRAAVRSYDPETDTVVPTEAACTVRDRYKEIMIDEFQDVSARQDLFFRALSSDDLFVVGDVKQSIYGFRHADPQNFLHKLDVFRKQELTENFRSRAGVLTFCNYVFERLFATSFGGISYTDAEKLVPGAAYPESPTPDVHVTTLNVQGQAPYHEEEARYVAAKIRELMASGTVVYDRVGEAFVPRPLRYSDICVLSRRRQAVFDVYEKTFAAFHIPLYAATGLTFFDTPEVGAMLALLSVIADPYDDIHLFSVMSSWLGDFSAEELANIRLCAPRAHLYTAARQYAKTDAKTAAFLKELDRLRLLANDLPLHRLVHRVYENGFLASVSLLEGGERRRENLMKLYSFAVRYAESEAGSVSGFLAFVERARSRRDSNNEATPPRGNFVRMMTIHGSKGLEFPVCFVVDIDPKKRDSRNDPPVLLDDELGFGTGVRDLVAGTERTTLAKELILLRNARREREEDLRMLYVALTRAREKLYIVSGVTTKASPEIAEYALCDNRGLSRTALLFASSCIRDLVRTALSHRDEQPSPDPFVFETCDVPDLPTVTEADGEKKCTGLSQEEMARRFTFAYPRALSRVPAGISVTELVKRRESDEGFDAPFDEFSAEPPAFISGTLSGARRGTALHAFFQYADLEKPFEDEKARLIKEHRLSDEEAATVRAESVRAYVKSHLYRELSTAKAVYREQPFLVKMCATELEPDADGGTFLLQGAMDAVYAWDDGLVVLDYKTDACDEDELRRRYGAQLRYYAVAAQRVYGLPVKKAVIWSFHLGKDVTVVPSPLDREPSACYNTKDFKPENKE